MKWFKHMSDLPRDEGVSRYLVAAGRDRVTAYGFLIFLLEAIEAVSDVVRRYKELIPSEYRITQQCKKSEG